MAGIMAGMNSNNRAEVRKNMAETLSELICSFLAYKQDTHFYNHKIPAGKAKTAAVASSALRREQVRFIDAKKTHIPDRSLIEECLKRILELKEEYADARSAILKDVLIPDGDAERRCIFRTFPNRQTAMKMMDFIRLYNRWTEYSIERLILSHRKKYELAQLDNRMNANITKADSVVLNELKERLSEQYDKKTAELDVLLKQHFEDLTELATELASDEAIENLEKVMVV